MQFAFALYPRFTVLDVAARAWTAWQGTTGPLRVTTTLDLGGE
jgi:hypothetical protein